MKNLSTKIPLLSLVLSVILIIAVFLPAYNVYGIKGSMIAPGNGVGVGLLILILAVVTIIFTIVRYNPLITLIATLINFLIGIINLGRLASYGSLLAGYMSVGFYLTCILCIILFILNIMNFLAYRKSK